MLNKHLQTASRNIRDKHKPNALMPKNVSSIIVEPAAQQWKLFLLLPQVVGRYVSVEDQAWQAYMKLKSVTDIVFAPVIRRSCLSRFTDTITTRTGIWWPSIDPKAPLHDSLWKSDAHVWATATTVVHAIWVQIPILFKFVINSTGNYINVIYSTTHCHEIRQSWKFTNEDILRAAPQSQHHTNTCQITCLPTDVRDLLMEKL